MLAVGINLLCTLAKFINRLHEGQRSDLGSVQLVITASTDRLSLELQFEGHRSDIPARLREANMISLKIALQQSRVCLSKNGLMLKLISFEHPMCS